MVVVCLTMRIYVKCFVSITVIIQRLIVQGIIAEADQDEDKALDFGEFTSYMEEHEKGLRLAFSDLDKNKDGMSSS